jgi:hypothetical protein
VRERKEKGENKRRGSGRETNNRKEKRKIEKEIEKINK